MALSLSGLAHGADTKAAKPNLAAGEAKIALHDLTGFNGRCDAILLTADAGFTPPNDNQATNELRRKLLNLPEKAPERSGAFL